MFDALTVTNISFDEVVICRAGVRVTFKNDGFHDYLHLIITSEQAEKLYNALKRQIIKRLEVNHESNNTNTC